MCSSCHAKILRKGIQTKNNLIVACCPYVIGELMIRNVEIPPKKSRKSKSEHKKYKKRPTLPDDDELDVLEFVEEEEKRPSC